MANDKERVSGTPSHAVGLACFPPLGEKKKGPALARYPVGWMKTPQDAGACTEGGVPLWNTRKFRRSPAMGVVVWI